MLPLPTIKKLRLSANALSKSFNINESDARKIIASAFDINSWDALATKAGKNDLNLTAGEFNSYNEFLAQRLASILDLDNNKGLLEVVCSISPYATKPKVFRYDLEQQNNDDETFLDLSGMSEMMDAMGDDNPFMKMLTEQMANSDDPESQAFAEQLRNSSFDEIQNRMRISHPMHPPTFHLLLEEILKWNLSETVEVFEHGEPSLYWIDQNDEEQPVFLNSLAVCPGDSKDEMYFSVLDMIGYDEVFEKPILLFGSCTYKQIGEHLFAVIGVWNDGHAWRWLFLSKLQPWEQANVFPQGTVDELENTLEMPAPPAALALDNNEGQPTHLVYHCIAKPSEEPTQDEGGIQFKIESRHVMTGVSGWKTFV